MDEDAGVPLADAWDSMEITAEAQVFRNIVGLREKLVSPISKGYDSDAWSEKSASLMSSWSRRGILERLCP